MIVVNYSLLLIELCLSKLADASQPLRCEGEYRRLHDKK